MTESEADRRAQELNRQLGAAGEPNAYYIAVEAEDGSWNVERRESKPGLIARIIEALPP